MTTIKRSRPRGQLPAPTMHVEYGRVTAKKDQVSVVVYGRPAPQGSKNPSGQEANPRTRPWRETIRKVCSEQLPTGWEPLDGPLDVDFYFAFERPASVDLNELPYTKTTYDLDKLQRAVHDGLVDGGVMVDDSRVVDITAKKRYCGEGEDERVIVVVTRHRSTQR